MHMQMQTSKALLLSIGIIFVCVLLFCAISAACGIVYDATMYVTMITASSAAFTGVSAFYLNKAKLENSYKIRRSYIKLKYLILKDIDSLDVQSELRAELDKIDCELDEQEYNASQDVDSNGL